MYKIFWITSDGKKHETGKPYHSNKNAAFQSAFLFAASPDILSTRLINVKTDEVLFEYIPD